MLEVKGLTKIYGFGATACRAIDNVNIEFGSSGLVVILGKSGCGKTTLLNMIGGMDSPTFGEVIINGQSMRRFKSSDCDAYRNTYVGIVFQEFNLIDEMSVFDNINMTMKLQEKNADLNTVDEALSAVGLGNLGYRKPNELSGGQRQRVALARALLKKPEIVLADEPTGALDSSTGEEVFETLKRISVDKLVIVVTHNRDLAHAFADRIIEMVDGRVVSDKTRIEENSDGVKEIGAGVIEVSAGGSVTKEQLEKGLKKDSVNYIGLSHDKDRIALSYPETVDSFYKEQDEAKYRNTTREDIKRDDKPFRLSSGGLKFKECFKVARESIRLRKKRTRFLIFMMSMCFMFFSAAVAIGSVSLPSVVALSAFSDGAQPFVSVGRGDRIYESDVETASEIMGEKAVPFTSLSFLQVEAPDGKERNSYELMSRYDMTTFDGILEANSLSEIGLSLIAGGGSESCKTVDEIIISDFAAHVLCEGGFVGYNRLGEYGIYRYDNLTDVIGCKIKFTRNDRFFTVVGIYDTDYERYAKDVGKTMSADEEERAETLFVANKHFMYSVLVGCYGSGKEFRTLVASEEKEISLETGRMGESYFTSASVSEMRYDATTINKTEKQMLWSKTVEEEKPAFPVELKENEMLISFEALSALMRNWSISKETFSTSAEFKTLVSEKISVGIWDDWNTSGNVAEEAEIVGVFDSEKVHGYSASLYFSPLLLDKILKKQKNYYSCVYFDKGNSKSLLETKLKTLRDYFDTAEYRGVYGQSLFDFGSATADRFAIGVLGEVLEGLGYGFMITACVLLVLAGLMTFNYMTMSARLRTKEIAVYRVIGAKTMDVAKIFLTEGGYLVAITSAIATVLSYFLIDLINSIIGGTASELGLSSSLIGFNWFVQAFLVLLCSGVAVFVSSVVPVLRVCGKSPSEAIKLI